MEDFKAGGYPFKKPEIYIWGVEKLLQAIDGKIYIFQREVMLTVSFWLCIPVRYCHFLMLSGVNPADTISSFGSRAALSQAPSLCSRQS